MAEGLSSFAGVSRLLLRDGILGLVDGFDVVEGRGSCWVVLRAPSGWGKTRLAREVYAGLAARQEGPRYWQAEIDPEGSDRKATFPKKVSNEPGALPEFFWWGISCSTQGGVPSDSLRRAMAQWEVHVEYLDSALKRLVSRRVRVGQHVREVGRAVAEEGMLEGAAFVAEQVASAAGVGLVVRFGRWSVKQAGERRLDRERVEGGGEFDAEARLGVIDEVVEMIASMTREGFPMVLLVEDAHAADDVLLELLDKALRRDGALLVISTVRSDLAERNKPLAELMEKHKQRLYEVDYEGECPEIEEFPEGAGLGDLGRDARAAILHERFPVVEPRTEATLLDRYVNPLALKLFCEIPNYRESAEYRDDQGALVIPRGELAKLPKDIRKLYEKLWWALPDETRLALAVAYVVTPTSIHDRVAGGENRWSDPVLREVISAVDLANRDAVLAELDRAPSAHAWVRAVDDYLRMFAEDFHRTTAGNYHESELEDLANAKEKILKALAGCVLDARRTQPITTNTARSILALHAEDYIDDSAVAAEAILHLLDELADSPLDLAERVRLYEHYNDYLDHTNTPPHTDYAIRYLGATALGEHDQFTEAITTLQDLLADQTHTPGHDDPNMLATRHSLAHWLGVSGRVDKSIVAYRKLLADRERELVPDHRDTLTTRRELAYWIAHSGQVGKANKALKELLADCERVLDPDDLDTLTIRRNLAFCLGKGRRAADAVDVLKELLPDYERVLGLYHRDTLSIREDLAMCLTGDGRVGEANVVLEELLADRERVLGPYDRDTLTTRDYLA